MKILHIITGLGTGGAETMLLKLVKESENRPEQHVVVSMMDEGTRGKDIKRYAVLYCLNLKQGRFSLGAVLALINIIRKERPDVVQSWMYHANLIITLVNLFFFKKLYWNIRHSLSDISHEKPFTRFVIRLNAWFSFIPEAILNNSKKSIGEHEKVGFNPKKSRYVPNGFDTELFNSVDSETKKILRKKYSLPIEGCLIGGIARFHPMKNHAGLIKAFASVIEAYPSVYCVMAGSNVDNQNEYLATVIQENELQHRVILLGEQDRPYELYQCFDFLVSPSLWGEGFPNVIGEAMACGVPCIASDVGDSALLVGNTGFVYQPDDENGLESALTAALQLGANDYLELSAAARKRIVENFSIESIYEQYMEIYREGSN